MIDQLTVDEIRDCIKRIFPDEAASVDDDLLDALITSPESFERPSSGYRFDWADPETIRAAIQALQFVATVGFGIFNAKKRAPSADELKEKITDREKEFEELSEEERERIIQKVVIIIEDRAQKTHAEQQTTKHPDSPKDVG